VARAAAELHELRQRAQGRLPEAHRLLLSRKGLEQASDRRVAAARAARVAERAPGRRVLDATSGIGGDALALAVAGIPVVAADREPEAALFAGENLARLGHPRHAVVADARRPAVRAELLLLDPDRRPVDRIRRESDPASWSPPWHSVLELLAGFEGGCVKLAPAFDVERARPPVPDELPHGWQWVSLDGELKEVVLWTGCLAPAGEPAQREVLVLDDRPGRAGRPREARLAGAPVEIDALDPDAAARVAWLAEPDPAVIRSGLLGRLAREEELAPVGPRIAYLGGERRPTSPLLRCWRLLGSCSTDRRRVRALLREHDVGTLTVHRRGHPDRAEVLARRYRGGGSRRGELVVARLARGHRAWLVEPAGDA
jgi:hypothetical protein